VNWQLATEPAGHVQAAQAAKTRQFFDEGAHMLSFGTSTTIDLETSAPATARWNQITRVAFRFCFVYFGLYVLTTQMLSGLLVIPNWPSWEMPSLEELPPFKTIVTWTAVDVFGITKPLVITGSGSGDKTFNWIAAFCLLVIATAATVGWSVLDRQRANYVTLHKWFRLFLRFAAGSTMLVYGMMKVIPLQMPAPFLVRLVEPFGHFSPMGVLWSSIGASPAYERFAGAAELAAAVCLFIPRLSLAGAVILLLDSIQIFTLNMTYDVPVKLFSFHLILISLVLLAPDARRLLNVFVFDRPAPPSPQQPLFRGLQAQRIGTATQLVFAAYLIASNVVSARASWVTYGGGAPKPTLYGIWDVDTMTIDGVERAPLVTDYGRWRRVIVQNANSLVFQRMDSTFVFYPAKTDDAARTVTLTTLRDQAWKTRLTFDRRDERTLRLDGDMDGHQIGMSLRRFDHSKLPLLNRGFNWIQEYPFNR
jgi:hypothetical protein